MTSIDADGSIRVGADITSVDQVADSIARFGERYLQRVYTDHEREFCSGAASAAASFAARFAAKEAAIKVLRPRGHQPDWRSIEVRRDPGGWCTMALSGYAAALAEEAGIVEMELSLTHDDDIAAAVVIALCSSISIGAQAKGLNDLILNGAL
jgi:holo-[acyl-carrier protein] synthase